MRANSDNHYLNNNIIHTHLFFAGGLKRHLAMTLSDSPLAHLAVNVRTSTRRLNSNIVSQPPTTQTLTPGRQNRSLPYRMSRPCGRSLVYRLMVIRSQEYRLLVIRSLHCRQSITHIADNIPTFDPCLTDGG